MSLLCLERHKSSSKLQKQSFSWSLKDRSTFKTWYTMDRFSNACEDYSSPTIILIGNDYLPLDEGTLCQVESPQDEGFAVHLHLVQKAVCWCLVCRSAGEVQGLLHDARLWQVHWVAKTSSSLNCKLICACAEDCRLVVDSVQQLESSCKKSLIDRQSRLPIEECMVAWVTLIQLHYYSRQPNLQICYHCSCCLVMNDEYSMGYNVYLVFCVCSWANVCWRGCTKPGGQEARSPPSLQVTG